MPTVSCGMLQYLTGTGIQTESCETPPATKKWLSMVCEVSCNILQICGMSRQDIHTFGVASRCLCLCKRQLKNLSEIQRFFRFSRFGLLSILLRTARKKNLSGCFQILHKGIFIIFQVRVMGAKKDQQVFHVWSLLFVSHTLNDFCPNKPEVKCL